MRTKALIRAGDSEATSTSMWTETEANNALTAAYKQIMLRLVRKRHFAASVISYFTSNTTNPVATFSTATFSLVDLKSVHMSMTGVDLSANMSAEVLFLKPRDWSFIEQRLWGGLTAITTPAFYTLVGDSDADEVELWVDLPPTTGGSSAIRTFSYGIPKWDEGQDNDVPAFPHIFDQLCINLAALNLRVNKDMDIKDLQNVTAEMQVELFKQQWEPRAENDYSIPVQGRLSGRRSYFQGKGGWLKRGG